MTDSTDWRDYCGFWWISGVGNDGTLVGVRITNRVTGDSIEFKSEPDKARAWAQAILENAEACS